MRVFFVFLSLIFSSFCFSEKIKHVVNLGPNCINSFIFANHGLRFESLPLDWMVTQDFGGVCLAFTEDFRFFVDPQYLKYHNPGLTENSRYGFSMNHFFEGESYEIKSKLDNMTEFDLDIFLECLEPVQIKYTRRIQRLLDILNGEDPVYFFRLGSVDCSQLISFRDFLISKYPFLDFTIVVSDGIENPYYGLSKIQYFRLEYSEQDLQIQPSHPQWKEVFKSLELE